MRFVVRHTSVFMVNSVIVLKAVVSLTKRHKDGIDALTLLSTRKQKLLFPQMEKLAPKVPRY